MSTVGSIASYEVRVHSVKLTRRREFKENAVSSLADIGDYSKEAKEKCQ